MKILVLGLYYDNNLGDAVICDCVAARLHILFPDAHIDIRDYVNRTAFPAPQESSMKKLHYRRRRMLLRQTATQYTPWDKQAVHEEWKLRYWGDLSYIDLVCQTDYDLVVFGGGQVFMDYLALFAEAFVQRFAQKGTPMFFNACGTGPAFSRKIRERLSTALMDPNVKLVSSRDDVNRINRLYMKEEKQALSTYDPALWCSQVYGVKKDPDASAVGLGMMYTNSVSPKVVSNFWVRLIREMERRRIPWKIFVNGSGDDIAFARYVHSLMPELGRPVQDCFVPAPRHPEELVKMIAGFKSMISFRLHSHIIAASLDIPSVAMVWDNKLNFFFDKIGHAERCCTVRESADTVLAKLACAEREGYDRQQLEEQKHYADRLLYQSICKEMNVEDRRKYEQNK